MKKLPITILLAAVFFVPHFILNAQNPDFSLAGYATENGGTTGGNGGQSVTVSSYDSLKYYAEKPEPFVIYVSGTIKGKGLVTDSSYEGLIKPKSNKSIIGLGNSAFLDGIGLGMIGARNIIIRNIKFSMISVAKQIPIGSADIPYIYSALGDENRPQIKVNGGDLIFIKETNNVWIDHCEFYNEDPHTQHNQDLYDGLLDVSSKSGYITISWCYFHDHHKCTLVGSSDKDLHADRKITFHHNHYNNLKERVPLFRSGAGHFFNNYCYDLSASVSNTRMEACVRVEKNYYEKCKNTVISKNSSISGKADIIDNYESDCSRSEPIPDTCSLAIPYIYSNILTPTERVKALVTKYAGVGKIDRK